jgi:hypothetical protein
MLPALQERIVLCEGLGDLDQVIKLFLVRPVRALNGPVEFGAARGQHKELNAASGARGLEGSFEFRAPIDLNGADGKPKAGKRLVQDPLRGPTRPAIMAASTSIRLITSRAVKCTRRRPGRISTTIVSSWTKSPGARGT